MARERNRRRTVRDATRKGGKKKVCIFCSDRIAWVDYKDVNVLRRFMSDRGKIRARRVSGNCRQHQRDVAVAIKTARELALLPYTQRTVSDRGGRGGRGGGRDYSPGGGAERAPRAEVEESVAEEAGPEMEVEPEIIAAVPLADDEEAG